MAIELATAYVSLVPETSKLEKGLKDSFANVGKSADAAGKDIGSRLAKTAAKAMKDGWKPDQDIMAGIPDTKLDRIGARIGQVIGKGISVGLKGKQLGQNFGSSFVEGAGSIGLGSVISGWHKDLQGHSSKLGFMAGKALSAGLQAATAAGVGAVGLALTKGFDRLVKLDTASYKLKQILKASGRDAAEADKLSKQIQKSVEGTPFSLDQAFGTAVQAIGAGAQDIEKFMGSVADAAGFAGTDIERMGLIFTQVLAKGKLTGEETMQLMEAGLPAKSWIADSYNLTSDQFESMQQKGQITLDMLQKSIEDHAPGMAKALGNTLQGSIDNMQTALGRTGANFLAAVFGGPSGDATESLKDAVQRITEYLNKMSGWVTAHKDEIHKFFQTAKEIAGNLLSVLGQIGSALAEHPNLIKAVVGAFVAWKTIEGVSALLTTMKTLSTFLKVTLPADAAIGGAGIAAGLSKALPVVGQIIAAWQLGTTNPAWNGSVQLPADGGDLTIPDLKIGDRTYWPTTAADGVFGGPNASRERRGLAPIDPTGGLLMPAGVGGGGRGYMNYGRASAYLSRVSDAALLSRVPSGSYDNGAVSNLSQGLADCSSAVEDLVNIMDGRPTAGREMYTGNAAAWLASRGFAPTSMPVPGAMNVGFNSHHMEATLPGGTHFNWGSNASAASGGTSGAVGAFGDPSFTQHYYRKYDTGGWLPDGTHAITNATGKPELILNPEQQQKLADQGIDPQALLHSGSGAAPGPMQPGANVPSADVQAAQQGGDGLDFIRSMGFIPASASSSGVAGTSSLSGFINMGNSIVSGVIDTGVNLANQAVSAAIMAGAAGGGMGAGAAAAPLADMAASYGIQLAGNEAKRISSYWFGMAGIGADSIMEQLSPFGMPRWLGYDYTNFAPQLNIQQALTSTVEKMGQDAINKAIPQPVDTTSGPAAPSTPVPTPDAVPAQQFDAIAANSAQPQQNNAPLVGNLYATDIDGAFRALDQTQRRNMMQYAGRP